MNVLTKFENDPWKSMDVRVLTGLVCPATCPPGVRQYPGALKGCGVKIVLVLVDEKKYYKKIVFNPEKVKKGV